MPAAGHKPPLSIRIKASQIREIREIAHVNSGSSETLTIGVGKQRSVAEVVVSFKA